MDMKNGFTIVELLIVFAIIAFLSTGLVFYSRSGERQIILFREQTKVVSSIIKAKSLALATFGDNLAPCGYGAHFEAPNKIIVFKEMPVEANDLSCVSIDGVYTAANSAEKQEEILLDKTIKFGELQLRDILFIPPDPFIVIDNNFLKAEALIKIETIDGKFEKIIKVTNSGQITIK